jgi:hypothetical protein
MIHARYHIHTEMSLGDARLASKLFYPVVPLLRVKGFHKYLRIQVRLVDARDEVAVRLLRWRLGSDHDISRYWACLFQLDSVVVREGAGLAALLGTSLFFEI